MFANALIRRPKENVIRCAKLRWDDISRKKKNSELPIPKNYIIVKKEEVWHVPNREKTVIVI